jgi:hypothetical protein
MHAFYGREFDEEWPSLPLMTTRSHPREIHDGIGERVILKETKSRTLRIVNRLKRNRISRPGVGGTRLPLILKGWR